MKTKMMLMGVGGMLLASVAFAEMQTTFDRMDYAAGDHTDRPTRNQDLRDPMYGVVATDPDKVMINTHNSDRPTRLIDRPRKDGSGDTYGETITDGQKIISGGENTDHSVRYVDLKEGEINRNNPVLSAIAKIDEKSSNYRAGAQDGKRVQLDEKFRKSDGTWDSNYWAGYTSVVNKNAQIARDERDSAAGVKNTLSNLTDDTAVPTGTEATGEFTADQLAAAVAQCKAERDRHGDFLMYEEGFKLTSAGKKAPTFATDEEKRLHREYLLLEEGMKLSFQGKPVPSDCSKATPNNRSYVVASTHVNPNLVKDADKDDAKDDEGTGTVDIPRHNVADDFYQVGIETIDSVNDAYKKGLGDYCLGKPMRIESSTEGLSADDLAKAEAYKKMFNLAKAADGHYDNSKGCSLDILVQIQRLEQAKAEAEHMK